MGLFLTSRKSVGIAGRYTWRWVFRMFDEMFGKYFGAEFLLFWMSHMFYTICLCISCPYIPSLPVPHISDFSHLAFLMTKWLSWGDRVTLTSQMAFQMFHMWTFEIHDSHRNWIFMLKFNCTVVSNKGISSCDVGGLSKSNGWAKRWRGTIYLGEYCGMHEKRYIHFFFPQFFSFGVWHKHVCSSHFV